MGQNNTKNEEINETNEEKKVDIKQESNSEKIIDKKTPEQEKNFVKKNEKRKEIKLDLKSQIEKKIKSGSLILINEKDIKLDSSNTNEENEFDFSILNDEKDIFDEGEINFF